MTTSYPIFCPTVHKGSTLMMERVLCLWFNP